jgi:pimeloyl-ACP methyl ester carboxylesterase
MSDRGSRARVVLVHGAWHGSWCWAPVLDRLKAAGVPAYAVDLPRLDLHDDAATVLDCLDGLEGSDAPVILVGHSYGGAVITEAGQHPAVTRLVYLAAFALDEDETCGTAAAGEPDHERISHTGRPDLGSGFRIDAAGLVTLDPGTAATCLYGDCDAATIADAQARLRPQALVTLRQQPAGVAWRTRPSTYAICSDDLCVHPDLQRILARRCTDRVEWATSHSPFLSRPELVADLLTRLVVAA